MLFWLWMTLTIAQAQEASGCLTPRDAGASLVENLQTDHWKPALAAACLDTRRGAEAREKLAIQLKEVLDARGLFVPTGELSTDEDYTNDDGLHQVILHPSLPQVYLERAGDGRWLYSRSTVGHIPDLYAETFSPLMLQLQEQLPPVFMKRVMGLQLWQYLYFVLLVLASMGVGRLSNLLLTKQVIRIATRLELAADLTLLRRIRGPLTWFAAGLVFKLGLADLKLGVSASFFLNVAATSLLSLSLVIIINRVLDVVADLFEKRAEKTDSKLDDQVIPLLSRAAKTGVWVLGVVFILQNLGVEVTALLAGVSVGGVAVALAAQDTIGNLFGSLTIFTDRPFQIGDWVIIDGKTEGVVEEVGFRSTRIRTFGKSVITVPNAKVANSAVDNMGQRNLRRLKLDIGLRYDTSPAKIRTFLDRVRARLAATEAIHQPGTQVRLINFGDSALEVMLYTFLDVPDWDAELEVKQELLLSIMEIAEELGIGFAFPSVSIYTEPS